MDNMQSLNSHLPLNSHLQDPRALGRRPAVVKRGGFGGTAALVALRKAQAASQFPGDVKYSSNRARHTTEWYVAMPKAARAYLKRHRPPAS